MAVIGEFCWRLAGRSAARSLQFILPVEIAPTMIRSSGDLAPTASTQASRLWCPGLVFVNLHGDVRIGRSVGYSSRDESFRGLSCGYRSRVEYWTHAAWLAPSGALTAAVVAEHAIILPESLIDREAQPHAHRWLCEQPLVCVSGTTWKRLAAAGVPVFRVAFDASGDRVLAIETAGGATLASSVTVALDALEHAVAAQRNERQLLDVQGNPSPIDRVLRAVTGGVLDESSVLNAFEARCLVEDGYGYRGALEGSFNEMSHVAGAVEVLDELFGQVFGRGKTLRAVAERVVAALGEAKPEANAVAVPLYGEARAVVVPPLSVPLGEHGVLDRQAERVLELPARRRWAVDGADSWSPELPANRG